MKTILACLVMISLLGVCVFAETQNIDTTVDGFNSVVISPSTLSFGNVIQGTNNNAASNGPITFNAGSGANTNMKIEVTDVTGNPFSTGLKFDGSLAKSQVFGLTCVISGSLCTYVGNSTIPTLDVPTGFAAGYQTGIITYTVTGTTPPAPLE